MKNVILYKGESFKRGNLIRVVVHFRQGQSRILIGRIAKIEDNQILVDMSTRYHSYIEWIDIEDLIEVCMVGGTAEAKDGI